MTSVKSDAPDVSASDAIVADATVPNAIVDVRGDLCPMTYVRTRLALDRLAAGATLLVLAKGQEPLANIPANARAQGHAVLAETHEPDGSGRILLRKGGVLPGAA